MHSNKLPGSALLNLSLLTPESDARHCSIGCELWEKAKTVRFHYDQVTWRVPALKSYAIPIIWCPLLSA